jgi:hypothetical protein
MLARVDLVYRLSYQAIRADHVCDSFGVLSGRRIACAVSHSYFSLCIGKQAEGKIELLGKSPVLFYCIKAYAKYLCVLRFELLDSITESNAFDCSARRVCLRIKPQHNGAARKVAQSHVFARVRLHGEIRRFISYIQHDLILLSDVRLYPQRAANATLRANGKNSDCRTRSSVK